MYRFVFLALVLIGTFLCAQDKEKSIIFEDAIGKVTLERPAIGKELEQSTKNIAPGITQEIRFVSPEGGAAVLVSTKIRAGLPKDDAVLERVEPKYKSFGLIYGKNNFADGFRGEKPNRIYEYSLINAEYNEFYPYAIGSGTKPDDAPKTIGLSQFFAKSDRMFEPCVFLNNDEHLDREKLQATARTNADRWRATINIER